MSSTNKILTLETLKGKKLYKVFNEFDTISTSLLMYNPKSVGESGQFFLTHTVL